MRRWCQRPLYSTSSSCHAPVHPKLLGHPLDRADPELMLSSNLLEELHFVSSPPAPRSGLSPKRNSRLGFPGRAKSEHHSRPLESIEISQFLWPLQLYHCVLLGDLRAR